MRSIAKMTLLASALSLVTATAALAQPAAVNVTISPAFAEDAGEEPELVGLYVIGQCGTPFRLGYALGNEFSTM